MDSIDKQILNRINHDFPLEAEPFKTLATELKIKDLQERIQRLKTEGLIRRLGATISPKQLGWYSTLCACEIEESRIDEFAALTSEYNEITHNYVRSGEINCWFTVIAPSQEECSRILNEISQKMNIEIREMPARKVFKIRASFEIR